MYTRGLKNIGPDYGCMIVNVANVALGNERRNQWRTPRLIKVFNSVSPEMRAKRERRHGSAYIAMSQGY